MRKCVRRRWPDERKEDGILSEKMKFNKLSTGSLGKSVHLHYNYSMRPEVCPASIRFLGVNEKEKREEIGKRRRG